MYHRSSASHPFPPIQGASHTSKAPQPSRTARAQEMFRPSMPSTHTFALEPATQNRPKTPPRIGTTSSANASPSIDAVRALYRKYPHQFPKTPPQVGRMPPNAPRGAVPPRYRDSVFDTSPGSPTPVGPRSRPRTTSHSETRFRRKRIATSMMNSRCKRPADAAADEPELTLMYPDFGLGFVPADDPAPNLALDIISSPHDREKWELPQRDVYESWKGNGWRLQLVISYTSIGAAGRVDLNFEPSIAIQNVTIDCSLAAKPRPISGTTMSARRPSESYEVTYRGFSTTCTRGILEPMQVDCGIHMDCNWHGPNLASASDLKIGESETRVEYRANIYIPIPFLLFSAADTRAFNIDARACVSVANRPAVQLMRTERITLSQLGQVSGYDDSVGCVLTGNR